MITTPNLLNILNPCGSNLPLTRSVTANIGGRNVWSAFGGNTVYDDTAVIAWMNNYDITTVPWGSAVTGHWTAVPFSAAPAQVTTAPSNYFCSVVRNGISGGSGATADATYVRTQLLFPQTPQCTPANYILYCFYWNMQAGGGTLGYIGQAIAICTAPWPDICGLIDLPVFNPTRYPAFDDYYGKPSAATCFYVEGSPANDGVYPSILAPLATTSTLPPTDRYPIWDYANQGDTASTWNRLEICDPTGSDPFNGDP